MEFGKSSLYSTKKKERLSSQMSEQGDCLNIDILDKMT
jgi:hypothetical protein